MKFDIVKSCFEDLFQNQIEWNANNWMFVVNCIIEK